VIWSIRGKEKKFVECSCCERRYSIGNSMREIRLCDGLHHRNIWFNGPNGNNIKEPMSPPKAMLESHPQTTMTVVAELVSAKM
jgi:hypothetical protein